MDHQVRFTAQKIARLLDLIEPLVYRQRHQIAPFFYRVLDQKSAEQTDGIWQMIEPNTYWGGQNINFVMRGEFKVPVSFDPNAPAALFLPLGDANEFSHPEALVSIDGQPYAAVDRHHQEILLSSEYHDANLHQLELRGWTGYMGAMWRIPGEQLLMRPCLVVQIDQPTRNFLILAHTALQTANLLDELDPAKTRLYNALEVSYRVLYTHEPFGDAFYASIPAGHAALIAGIDEAGSPLDAEIIAVGHAHIDVAWLWDVEQTRRKVERTFNTVLRQMEQFPDYHFTQSQPQLYEFVRQDAPELFTAIQKKIAERRWEPIGGMWVEADNNITGPESLARQFLLGRSYFREHFGFEAESPVLWLPDVFGYTWNLPQLIKQAGMEYFFTIKIGWNQYNKLPFDSFWWQGLDGTRVLTHFSTTPDQPWKRAPEKQDLVNTATYNAQLSAFSALGSWAKLQHKADQKVMLMSYGYGDGGGGPTREMNENAQVLKSFPSLPKVKQGRVIDFFQQLEVESGDQLPVWNAELYLELHRGTYTSQARTKRANRKTEFLLHDAEFLAAYASWLSPGYKYPTQELNKAWQLLCLNQFHDIIPGSSIGKVYQDAAESYRQAENMILHELKQAIEVIASYVGGDVLVINPTGFTRQDLAFWPGELAHEKRYAGQIYTQAVEGGTLLGGLKLSPFSAHPLRLEIGEPPCPDVGKYPLRAAADHLENAFLRVEFNASGDIHRIYDKINQRELLAAGEFANQFQAFEDRPLKWDAWDIDIYYEDKLHLAFPAESIQVVEQGPLRAVLEIQRRILNSRYTQRISLTYNSPLLVFDTTIDWRERHMLLKTGFPVDVLVPFATHEIQWGSVQRPTHRNTSWDWARFETAAQKWVDLSEGGYGVALINDCKYGYDVHDNVLRLSLLRAPLQPDPEADQGEHQFAYGLYPHSNPDGGQLVPSELARIAYPFNDPLIVVEDGGAPAKHLQPLVQVPANVVVETIKGAEDGNGIIVRLYECNRQRGMVTLHAAFPLKAAIQTNLLEEDQFPLEINETQVKLNLKPFQIVTLRLVPMLSHAGRLAKSGR